MAVEFEKSDGKKASIRFLSGVRHEGVDYGPGHDGGEIAEIDAREAARYVREGRAELPRRAERVAK